MKWSWKVGRLAGIEVRVHATFFLLLAWIGWAHFAMDRSVAAAVAGVSFVALLFSFVILHELGHALMARRFGISTRDITLLPIGGIARLERMPDDPRQELLVAVAGPAVNLVLASVFFGLALLVEPKLVPDELVGQGSLLLRLGWINLALALFNMVPAFPMDGGRALRALLATRMESTRATRTAAALGQAVALAFGFIGLLGYPILIFIALFVWLGAEAEARAAEVRHIASGIPVEWAMVREAFALAPHDPLSRAADLSARGFQHDFPIVEAGRVVGVLCRHDLLRAVTEREPATPLGAVMRLEFETVHPGDALHDALERLQQGDLTCLPVVSDDGRLAGLLTMDGVGELLAIRSAAEVRATKTTRPTTVGLRHRSF